MDDMQKRLKKYSFLNENEVVRIRKTLVWLKYFSSSSLRRKRMHLKTHLYVTLVPGLYLAHCEKREGRGGEETARKK